MSDANGKKPKQHKALKVILGIVAAFVLLIVIGSVIGSSSSQTANTSSTSNASSTSSSGSAASSATPGLNHAAQDGKFQFTVTSFACGQSQLENGNEFEAATAQGQFCVMKLNVTNIGTEAQQFDASSQYVYTADGKQLSYSSDGTTAANTSGNNCYVYQTINPGNNLSCNVAFDVPSGVTPTYAMLHDSSFSGGVKINLQ